MKHSSKTHRNLSDVEGTLFKLKKMRPADKHLPVTAQSLLLDPHIIEVDLSQNPSARNHRQPKTTRNKPKTPYLTGEKPYQTNASSATGVSMLQQNVWMMPQFDPYAQYHSPISTIYSREEYVYKQQLGEFVKDIKNNGPEGVLNSARKQALTPSNRPSSSSLQPEQAKEMALIIKFKDEQIFELRRQLQLLNTHKDRVLQECQLLKTREDTHKAQIRELQDMLERQMKQKDEVHNKYIKEQEYSLQLRQENHSLKMAIRETSKERDQKVINETSVYQLPHARMSISRVNQNALTQMRSGDNKLLQQSTISSSNTFFKASQTSSVLIPSFVIPHKHSPLSKPTQHKMMMVNKPRDPGYYEGETQQAHEDSGVGAIIPSSSGWIPTSANHNRLMGENPSFHSSPQQKQPFNMKTVKKGISESLTYRNPSSIKQSQTPAESLTGSGRRGHYQNADFVNRNLLSQVPQILAWHGDAIEDGIRQRHRRRSKAGEGLL